MASKTNQVALFALWCLRCPSTLRVLGKEVFCYCAKPWFPISSFWHNNWTFPRPFSLYSAKINISVRSGFCNIRTP